jgi:TrmH family RNA methyltransferase
MITSLQNPQVKHWVKLRKDSSYRHETQSLWVEGKKLVAESEGIITLISTNPNTPNATIVSEEVFQKISGMQAPEGIAAEVRIPKPAEWTALDRLLILDGISDPGNLGTLFRTALALGWQGIYLLNNCCDVFNDKALSAARGASLKLPFRQGDWNELMRLIQKFELTPIAADLSGVPLDQFESAGGIALALGNEAHGPSKDTLHHCKRITIPINSIESLNVAIAGGILMYQLRSKP